MVYQFNLEFYVEGSFERGLLQIELACVSLG